jgi:DnaJ family protein C protein 19
MGLFLALILICFIGYKCWIGLKKYPPEQRRKLLLKSSLFAFLGVTIALAVSGRVSWIMAAIAALLPLVKIFFGLLWRGLPFIQIWMRNRQSRKGREFSSDSNATLTETEAWEILGLNPGSSKEEIIRTHRELMQKIHPDRGGSNYIASKLNLARDLLLKK